LVGDLNTVYQESPLDYSIPVMYVGTDSLPSKFDTCDLTKKCFVKGELRIKSYPLLYCSHLMPMVAVLNIDDIYFE
jgi:hypothetical protein